MGKIFSGVGDVARQVKSIYVGVNGVARKVTRAYVGVNGIAKQIYNGREYLFNSGVDNTAITGGWTGGFTQQTNAGENYTMTRMTNQGTYLYGKITATADEAVQRCMYVRSVKAIDLTSYHKLFFSWRHYYRTNAGNSAVIGAFNPSYTTCRPSQVGERFLAYAYVAVATSSSYVKVLTEIDVSSVNQTAFILFTKRKTTRLAATHENIIDQIWLE